MEHRPLDIRGFKAALLYAKASPCSRYWVGAALFKGKKFISGGHNSGKSHPKSKRPRAHNICAELMAILRAKGDTEGCTLYVLRIGRRHNLLPIEPCKYCKAAIEEAGITRVFSARDDNHYMTQEVGTWQSK